MTHSEPSESDSSAKSKPRGISFAGWAGPVVGALVGLGLACLDAQGCHPYRVVAFVVCGAIGGAVIWWMEYIDAKAERSTAAPNAVVSRLLLVGVPFVFWIPLVGFIWTSVVIYRAHWMKLPDFVSLLLVCFFFLAFGSFLGTVIILTLDLLGTQ